MPATEQHPATVLPVDDHPLMRKGLHALLEGEPGLAVAGEAGDGERAIEQAKALSPDIVVMDVSMPNLSGIDATRHLLAEAPETQVKALSIHSEKRFVDEMLRAPAVMCSRTAPRKNWFGPFTRCARPLVPLPPSVPRSAVA